MDTLIERGRLWPTVTEGDWSSFFTSATSVSCSAVSMETHGRDFASFSTMFSLQIPVQALSLSSKYGLRLGYGESNSH